MCLSPCQFPGSSPLTRGKPEYAHDCACVDGLIPAHAGKTVSGSINSPPAGAHPRSRGENQNANATLRDYRGSSPLTRGKRANVVSEKYQVVAHPRSRGENVLDAIAATRRWGSSPLTRGKQLVAGDITPIVRLIPAHAGKTYEAHALATQTGAHPRSRGENARAQSAARTVGGSSPLTRGKRRGRTASPANSWLIPAHAGKTRRHCRPNPGRRAHPRSRGENAAIAAITRTMGGSSPLTRGKQGLRLALSGDRGLIPAHAGKTSWTRSLPLVDGAHPRSRGENPRISPLSPRERGSSPLTRGKHLASGM